MNLSFPKSNAIHHPERGDRNSGLAPKEKLSPHCRQDSLSPKNIKIWVNVQAVLTQIPICISSADLYDNGIERFRSK